MNAPESKMKTYRKNKENCYETMDQYPAGGSYAVFRSGLQQTAGKYR